MSHHLTIISLVQVSYIRRILYISRLDIKYDVYTTHVFAVAAGEGFAGEVDVVDTIVHVHGHFDRATNRQGPVARFMAS